MTTTKTAPAPSMTSQIRDALARSPYHTAALAFLETYVFPSPTLDLSGVQYGINYYREVQAGRHGRLSDETYRIAQAAEQILKDYMMNNYEILAKRDIEKQAEMWKQLHEPICVITKEPPNEGITLNRNRGKVRCILTKEDYKSR